MKIQHVPIEYVNQVWPKVTGFLGAAVSQQSGVPDYTLEQVQVYVATGQWVLLVAVDEEGVIWGAATVHLFNRPSNRVAFVTYIGGRLITNNDAYKQMCAVLKSFGATSIEGAVNDAVAKLWQRFGFTEKYKIVGVTL
jgi:hypothetical protein